MNRPLEPIDGHELAVTDGIRTHVDCTCGLYIRAASKRAGNIAGLLHYLAKAPSGPERDRAQALLDERTTP